MRQFVQALVNSMQTGSPTELDSLCVPGSQAEGNAGATAHVVQGTGRAFVTINLQITTLTVNVVAAADATAHAEYTLTGYDAQWPSLKQIGTSRSVDAHHDLELQLLGGKWLVSVEN